jgi:hypothetical protein
LQTLGFDEATKRDHGEQLARTNKKMGTQDIRLPMKETDHLAAIPAEALKKGTTREPAMVHQRATNTRHINTKLKINDQEP